ncbi:hypothetical protein P153DRAFT_182793 [Dothidotthia symphoricarpi CBS 119687]|uniref:Uncharacterized protein n=1 Tax=Dothidotthia symphoricarpi CBS 119687 TaxID=1392245 RepID=A0A6A6AND7_9PLEO|nr:uncharacterized protein P153DRAFT_182793 [Dothidotthia symphoricarpi CBS 119687]KAF2132001.1 hypothetical protein P153DRAFT_182793 [Dothidotthia symphoricarpi CBS 119687]
MTAQSGVRRRGGTHKVKDGDKTDSKYDEWNHTELVRECKARELYIKDMKKAQMTKTLLRSDIEKERMAREVVRERKRRQEEAEQAKKKAEDDKHAVVVARYKRNEEKQRKRERGEDVSEDEMDEDGIEVYHRILTGIDNEEAGTIGYLLSDVSWDSTSTESTTRSVNEPIIPACKLRLFEWPYHKMPTISPPRTLRAPSYTLRQEISFAESRPRHVPYAPLKLMTTMTLEKLTLPGQTYPPEINPDYAPLLSQQTRAAVRNGILEGVLRKAVIEKASIWAGRTHVQGWNARIFFTLRPHHRTKKLVDVYRKWYRENRKLLRVNASVNAMKTDRERRHVQRHKNKGRKTFEVYEAAQCRPTAICYLPAYLECDPFLQGADESDQKRTLENLFYIRFPGCDVPHYYFWADEGGWPDPTIRNPAWDPTRLLHEDTQVEASEYLALQRLKAQEPQIFQKRPVTRKTLARVKKQDIVSPILTNTCLLPFETIVIGIEHELYANGLQVTIFKYRQRWLASGKFQAWKSFGRALPTLYPSGRMPDAPPVHSISTMSIAQKIAISEALQGDGQSNPIRGDEPWTRNDDELWDVIEIEEDVEDSDVDEVVSRAGDRVVQDGVFCKPIVMLEDGDMQEQHECVVETSEKEHNALCRRSSLPLHNWAKQLVSSSVATQIEDAERAKWEQRFLKHIERETSLACPIGRFKRHSTNPEAVANHTQPRSKEDHLLYQHHQELIDSGEDADIDSDGPNSERTKTTSHSRQRSTQKAKVERCRECRS